VVHLHRATPPSRNLLLHQWRCYDVRRTHWLRSWSHNDEPRSLDVRLPNLWLYLHLLGRGLPHHPPRTPFNRRISHEARTPYRRQPHRSQQARCQKPLLQSLLSDPNDQGSKNLNPVHYGCRCASPLHSLYLLLLLWVVLGSIPLGPSTCKFPAEKCSSSPYSLEGTVRVHEMTEQYALCNDGVCQHNMHHWHRLACWIS
jgi:hypothetical protein